MSKVTREFQGGWRLPPDREHEIKYSISKLGFEIPQKLEKIFPTPPEFPEWFNQGNTPHCVGFACAQMQATYNALPPGHAQHYDGNWLYYTAREIGGLPASDETDGGGAFTRDALKALTSIGIMEVGETTPELSHGGASYYWCRNIDEVRLAFDKGRCVVFGLPWRSLYMYPKKYNRHGVIENWIGRHKNEGISVGGHCIMGKGFSDIRKGVLLKNTWGADWPRAGALSEVWITFKELLYALQQGGECGVMIDRPETG